MTRRKGKILCAFGVGLLFASFCPPKFLITILAVILVIYGCNC